MTDGQENKLSMYRTTEQTLADNNAIWSGIAAMVTTKTAFSAKIAAIQTATQQQDTIITGITADKKNLKSSLVNIATPIASAVTAFASQANNQELLEQVNYSRTQLQETKDDLLGQRCQNIHDRANENIVALADYGITAPVLTTLQTAINNYSAKVPQPRTAQSAKKAITTLIKNLFAETDVMLKLQLDKLMVQFKTNETEFYNSYTGAREIINLGATSAKVRGQVLGEDNAYLPGVKFIITQTGTDTIVKEVFTDAKGNFSAAQLPAGNFDFRWKLAEYFTETETNVHIAAGKELKRKITMHPGGGSATLSGNVPMGGIANISVNGLHVVEQTTIRLSVTGSTLRFYAATGNMDPPGTQYLDVVPGQIIQKTSTEFAVMVGFDEVLEDFLNVQNNDAVSGHWELKFENLGA